MTGVVRLRPSCPCGCYHPPGTPCPPVSCDPCGPSNLGAAGTLPRGVTDGSNALPGQVGEWFQAQVTIAYQQNVPLVTNVAVGTLPPGDWDIWSAAQILPSPGGGIFLDALDYYLSPLPPGFTHTIGQGFATSGNLPENIVLPSPAGRANTTVPTALNYYVSVNSTTGGGSLYILVMARRMR